MKICPQCNIEYQDNMKFCPECGSKLESMPNKCPNCGAEYKDGQKFCSECGTKLEGEAVAIPSVEVFSQDIVDLCNKGIEYYKSEDNKYNEPEDELVYQKAVQCLMKSAEAGYPKAMLYLSLCYEYGKGLSIDVPKAIELRRKAITLYRDMAIAGNIEAQYELGNCYDSNFYVDEDEEKAKKETIKWYTKAAESGHKQAMAQLAFCYKYYENVDKAIELYNKAAASGSVDAMNSLGDIYRNEVEDLDKAIEWYTKAAISGSDDALDEIDFICILDLFDYDKAIELFSVIADSGSIEAFNFLGDAYDYKEDYDKAIECYSKAAKNGSIKALQKLGNKYGSLNDYDQAIVYFTRAIDLNCKEAILELADVYCLLGNYQKALKYYDDAIKSGVSEVYGPYSKKGDCYLDQKEFSLAVECYQKGAEKGESKSLERLGDCCFLGLGKNQDYKEAFTYYKKSIEDNHNYDVEQKLEKFYDKNGNVKKDKLSDTWEVKARFGDLLVRPQKYKAEQFLSAAKNGDPKSQYEVAKCYYYGMGFRIDPEEATKWFREAAEQYLELAEDGDRNAQLIIGDCLCFGEKSDKVRAMSLHWYKLAADAGLPEAQLALGNAYNNGIGGKVEHAKAFQCYEKASQAGNIEAKYALGNMYSDYFICKELRIKKDDRKTIPLFINAAESGHSKAQYDLARCYETGYNGVTKNIDFAYKWYRKSLENGEIEAFLGIERLKKEYPQKFKEKNNAFEHTLDNSSNVTAENTAIDKCIPYVFFIKAIGFEIEYPDGKRQHLTCGDGEIPSWTGTGFLLSDGRFVTARHVVEAWAFPSGGGALDEHMLALNIVANNGGKINAHFVAISSTGKQIHFNSDQCVINHKNDKVSITENGAKIVVAKMNYDDTDYAYFQSGQYSGLTYNNEASISLAMRTKLVVLGFPLGIGANSDSDINPIYGSGIVARNGLQNGVVLTTDSNYEQGNSGGPVFKANNKGDLEVIGLVSAGAGNTIGFIVPIAAVK